MSRASMIEKRPGHAPRHRFGSDDQMVTSRLRTLFESLCISEISRQTGASRQSIHRYLAGHPASVSFLMRLCEATETSAEWLLLGRGAQRRADAVAGALAEASAAQLCTALAHRIDPPQKPRAPKQLRLVSDGG